MEIVFRHDFVLPVWRIKSSANGSSSWVIEQRNPEVKEVHYFFVSSLFRLSELNTGLSWWSGVESLCGDIVLFHEFIQEDLPLHKGIIAFDGNRNQEIWRNEFVKFASLEGKVIKSVLISGSRERTIFLDAETGEETSAAETGSTGKEDSVNIITENQPFFSDIRNFIKNYSPFEPVKAFEYTETESYIIVSYFVQNEDGKTNNYLLATDAEGNEELHLCLNTDLKGIIYGTYHLSEGFLSFVQERKEFYIIKL